MNTANDGQRLSLQYTDDGTLLFRAPYNAEFAGMVRCLGGRLLSDQKGWEFPFARRFPDLENIVRTAAQTCYGGCPGPQQSDAYLFDCWDDAMDAAVECGYLDGMLAGSALA